MRFIRLIGATCAIALCLPAVAAAQGGGDNIAKLEKARSDSPRSAAALRALGVAYYRAERFSEARATLEQARLLSRTDGAVALYLGMSAERSGDLSAARAAYSDYLVNGRTRKVKNQIRARLVTLRSLELQAAAKEAVQKEGELSQTAGAPTTVAVLPLKFSGADSALQPLERGFADLLITDLSRSATLTIVERDRMQALADEIRLSQSASVDPAASVRGGRLLRAGRVVQGSISQLSNRSLQVDAAVIDVPTTQAVSAIRHDDQIEQLFAIEKKVAFDLFKALGVQLSANERALVEQRPTRSLAAFLAYSAGLQAEDNGNLDEAKRFYGNAVRLDPSFTAAQKRHDDVESAQFGETVTTASLEATLAGTNEGLVVNAADRGIASPEPSDAAEAIGAISGTLTSTINDLNPSPAAEATGTVTPPAAKDPASATQGTDNPAAGSGRIRIVIPQPRRSKP